MIEVTEHAHMHAHNYIQNGHIHSFHQYLLGVLGIVDTARNKKHQRLSSWSLYQYYGRQRKAVPKYAYTTVRCAMMKIQHKKGSGECSVFYMKEDAGSEHRNTKEQ